MDLKPFFKNASFVVAGGACLLMIAGHFFYSPDGLLPIKGFRFVAALAIPMLCFWAGMLIRWKVGKLRWWVLAIAAALMFATYVYSFCIQDWLNVRFQWWGLILLGFILPWDYLYERRDPDGVKSFIVLLISALAFSTINLVNSRMMAVTMPSPVDDLGSVLKSVTKYTLPFVAVLPAYFAVEFSFSKAGQWLGSKIWFRIICWIAAATVFINIISNLSSIGGDILVWRLTQLAVQPVTVYLFVVICRIICNLRKKEMTWKEVLNI